jgi:uncharacterized SAM-binding protein YcdF (DUF218 family)
VSLLLAKAAGYLLMPPGIFLAGAVLAWLVGLRWRRAGIILGLLVLATAYAASTRPVADALLRPLEARYPALETVPAGAEAIVVLGGGQRPYAPEYGRPALGAETLVRARFAARLARGSRLPVFPTGGLPLERGTPTGRLMTRALVADFGIAPGRVHPETASRNTAEHVQLLKPLLRGRERVVLVTSAWHMPRAMAVFEAGGLDPVAAPTGHEVLHGAGYHWLDLLPQAEHLAATSRAVHEYLGIAWYAMRGWV